MRSVADILELAADLIEPEGAWMQGGLRAFRGGRPFCWCVVGAIHEIDCLSRQQMAARNFLRTVVGAPPPAWNDAPERTQAEVVAKLREAAALARETQP